jgi:hypothetical protein
MPPKKKPVEFKSDKISARLRSHSWKLGPGSEGQVLELVPMQLVPLGVFIDGKSEEVVLLGSLDGQSWAPLHKPETLPDLSSVDKCALYIKPINPGKGEVTVLFTTIRGM